MFDWEINFSEELKEALKALRAEVQTLKDFPFSAVVSYVRNHLAAKYECIRSH